MKKFISKIINKLKSKKKNDLENDYTFVYIDNETMNEYNIKTIEEVSKIEEQKHQDYINNCSLKLVDDLMKSPPIDEIPSDILDTHFKNIKIINIQPEMSVDYYYNNY